MNNINAPIYYPWQYGWSGEGQPSVNLLLKAIIETDRNEMDRLYAQGASLDFVDDKSLSRVLYHIVGNYSIMEWIVKHGYSIIENKVRTATTSYSKYVSPECTSCDGFVSGLSGRAYFLGSYDVFELLVSNGFDAFYCYEKGWAKAKQADEEIFSNGDVRGIRILLEHGYRNIDYILKNKQIKRKSVALDPMKFAKEIPYPTLEPVPLFIGRSETKRRNARRIEDYEDLVRTHSEFSQTIGRDAMNACRQKEEEARKSLSDILKNLHHF